MLTESSLDTEISLIATRHMVAVIHKQVASGLITHNTFAILANKILDAAALLTPSETREAAHTSNKGEQQRCI